MVRDSLMSKVKTTRKKLRLILLLKEVVMVSIALVTLGLAIWEHAVGLSDSQIMYVDIVELVASGLFLAEFTAEWFFARDRGRYIRHNWFFLLAAVPITSMSFELLKAVRLLRLLRYLKIFAELRYEYNTRVV